MAKEWNRRSAGKGGGVKNVRKEYNRQLAQTLRQQQEGLQTGPGIQDVRTQASQQVGSAVGDVQRGQAQAQLAAGGAYSEQMAEQSRQSGERELAAVARGLQDYRQKQDKAAMMRNQAATAGLKYERGERAKQRAEVWNTLEQASGIAAEQINTFLDIWERSGAKEAATGVPASGARGGIQGGSKQGGSASPGQAGTVSASG